MSTIAILRRETNGWKWPLFQLTYMTVLAWLLAFVCYQGGHLLGIRQSRDDGNSLRQARDG